MAEKNLNTLMMLLMRIVLSSIFFLLKEKKKREKYDHRVLRAKNKCSDISSIELAAPQRMRFAAHLMSDNPAGSTVWRNRQVHTVMYNFSRFFHKMFI